MVVSCTTGQYLDIALVTGQCGIYCHGGSFDPHHWWDTTWFNLLRLNTITFDCAVYMYINKDSMGNKVLDTSLHLFVEIPLLEKMYVRNMYMYLKSLLSLFVYFLVLPSLLHPTILYLYSIKW